MRIVFRVDASRQMGIGHVMRCLTLAAELKRAGADVLFICREHEGDMIGRIEGSGFRVAPLPRPVSAHAPDAGDPPHCHWLGVSWQEDAADTMAALQAPPDWLVIDHYALDRRWERALRPLVGRILVVDDLADRPHDCDLLLDQNFCRDLETRYDALVPAGCVKLLGPRHSLLRPEFEEARSLLRERTGEVRRVHVFFGGADATGETEKALQALLTLTDVSLSVDVVVGASNARKERIREICAGHSDFRFYCQIDNMAQLMAAADLAVGAGGTANWERCYLGLPAVVVIVADNQFETSMALAEAGATVCLGRSDQVTVRDMAATLRRLCGAPLKVKEMAARSRKIMESHDDGGRSRLIAELMFRPSREQL